MKKLSTAVFIIIAFAMQSGFAQLKIGYVDSDAVFDKLPEAKDAQKKLDQFILEWNDELAKLEKEFQKKVQDFEDKKLIMSEKKRLETEKELMAFEKEISEFRQKKFGTGGDLFKKQEEVMKPVQNKVFNAIKEVSEKGDFDFVFDRSGDMLFLYAKEKHDLTNLVLEKLIK